MKNEKPAHSPPNTRPLHRRSCLVSLAKKRARSGERRTLDIHERAQLDLRRVVVRAVHRRRTKHERKQRCVVDVLDLALGPVVARARRRGGSGVLRDVRREPAGVGAGAAERGEGREPESGA